MIEFAEGYREVIPHQSLHEEWVEITLDTGSRQSFLQDLKVPERAGGYCYEDTSKYSTCNRFIHWHITHDVLELFEQSLNVNLVNNRVRYRFTDTPILDGVSIYEDDDLVRILVATVSSVHVLSFPHPEKIYSFEEKADLQPDSAIQSIFRHVSTVRSEDYHIFHVISSPSSTTGSPVAHAAASWYTEHREAIFALASCSGVISLVRMDITTGSMDYHELKQESMVPRFLSNIATALRGRPNETRDLMSLVLHPHKRDVHLLAICQDGYLRVWSCFKAQMLSMMEIISCETQDRTIQSFSLKRTTDSNDELLLCAYFRFQSESEFHIFKVSQRADSMKCIRLSTLPSPNQHLVDFSISGGQLWAVWRTSDDTIDVSHMKLPVRDERSKCGWKSGLLVPQADKDYITSDSGIDLRQAYVDCIFYPGKFSSIDLVRALNIYRKSNILPSADVSLSSIKETVCSAVEIEIQNEVSNYELTDEEYLEIVQHCWSRFYSCVIQYHLNGARPVGLLSLANVDGVILLKKSSISLLRRMEILEYLEFHDEGMQALQGRGSQILSINDDLQRDFISVMSATKIIDGQLTDEMKHNFEEGLYQSRNPETIIESVLDEFQNLNGLCPKLDVLADILTKLENVRELSPTIALFLEYLSYGPTTNPTQAQQDSNATQNSPSAPNLMGSYLGISILTGTLTQLTCTNLSVCRNLLILQKILLLRPELFDAQLVHTVKSFLLPRTMLLIQAHYILLWICKTSIPTSRLKMSLGPKYCDLLCLRPWPLEESLVGESQRSYTLLELFICCIARHVIRQTEMTTPSYIADMKVADLRGFSEIALAIALLIWPISENFVFADWLMANHHFLLMQDYVRLLSTWCEWNSMLRRLISAIGFLEMGESHKACDQLLKIASHTEFSSQLSHRLQLSGSSVMNYFLRVVEIFKHYGALDCTIEVASTALLLARSDEQDLATFHSIIFEQHLKLQHYAEAYNCLNTNPDAARRTDCLRQLVGTLFDQQKLFELISFPYIDMYQDLERILEAKARSVDLSQNKYYDFLYSFHLNKGNIKKAATIMYEQVMRLSQEPQSLLITARMIQCYLACMNVLDLVDKRFDWIVVPTMEQTLERVDAKSSIQREEDLQRYSIQRKMEILQSADVRQEFLMIESRWKLAALYPRESVMPVISGPREITSILANMGLYLDALRICDRFGLPKSPVMKNLASKCVSLCRFDDPNSCSWMNQNSIPDLGISSPKTADLSWRLLQHLTLSHEKPSESVLHKEVSKAIFDCGFSLPEWLYSSYKRTNASELLRLMIEDGRLDEAAILSIEYIHALLGRNKERFGINTTLSAITGSVCSPYNTFVSLLVKLECISREDSTYGQIYEELRQLFESYLKTAERVSEDSIRLKRTRS